MFNRFELTDIKKINYLKVLKIALGSSIAILIANLLGLSYSASAGIITLLSIQDTKKQTINVAKRRIIACFLAFIIAYVLFQTIGYYTYVFGIFLFIFISSSYLLKVEDGIAMCSVLVTHYLIEKNMSIEFIWNEILIFIIGATIGVIFNLFMPNNSKQIRSNIVELEGNMKNVLYKLGDIIALKEVTESIFSEGIVELERLFDELGRVIQLGMKNSYEDMNNSLLSSTRYYIAYFTMRKEQMKYLKEIQKQITYLTYIPKQGEYIRSFLYKIEEQYREHNNAETLLEELKQLKINLREEDNPLSREEFENRALLYIILNDMDCFLQLKRDFVQSLSTEDITKYWK